MKIDPFNAGPRVKGNPLPPNPETPSPEKAVSSGRFPSWLHRPMPSGNKLSETHALLRKAGLPTVCEEAKCPNLLECFSKKTATFLALGKQCTRNCGFCDIDHRKEPLPLDPEEPKKIAETAHALGLKHIVLTMVARDDLPDGGALQVAAILREIRQKIPSATAEVLTSDFEGKEASVDIVLAEKPNIFNHNIETVRRLTPRVRHKATYDRTLRVLRYVKDQDPDLLVKSGLMVGLGETDEEVSETIDDLRNAGCDIVTIGQYLQPNYRKLLVKQFITPEQFKAYADYGHSIGIRRMYCGPFVRSSYNAGEIQRKFEEKS